MKKLIPLVLLVGLMSVGACDNTTRSQSSIAKPTGGMFTSLIEGEQIEADYVTSGCFHHSHHRFLFQSNGGVIVAICEVELIRSRVDSTAIDTVLNLVGTLVLNLHDLRGLDNLVKHYQQLPDEYGCTTVDGVTFRMESNGELIDESSYTDGTCGPFGDDVLTLGMLIQRITDPYRDILE